MLTRPKDERRDGDGVFLQEGVAQKDVGLRRALLRHEVVGSFEERGIDHQLLPALEFMTIDFYDEPQIGSIKIRLSQLLKQHKAKTIFVTQGYICRNARGEVDNLKRGGSDYTASLIATEKRYRKVRQE